MKQPVVNGIDYRKRIPPSQRFVNVKMAILRAVKSHPRATYPLLLDTTGAARSTLSEHLQKMCDEHELLKEESKKDRRVVHYSLDSKGENTLMKEEMVSRLESDAQEAIRKLKVKIQPFQLLESSLNRAEEDEPFKTFTNLLKIEVYKGLSESASATVLSDQELKPEFIDDYALSQIYTSVLVRLIEGGFKNQLVLQKKLIDDLTRSMTLAIQKYVGLTSEKEREAPLARMGKGELSEIDDSIEGLVDETVDVQRQNIEGLRKLLDVRFDIVLEYDGKRLSPFLDDYLLKMRVGRPEIKKYYEETIRKTLSKSL